MIPVRKISRLLLMVLVLLGGTLHSFAQTPATPSAPIAPSAPAAPTAPRPPSVPSVATPLVNLQIGNGNERQNLSTAIQIVVVMTLLTLAPSLIMLMTSFTRIVIVLGFVRTALGVPSAPANQLLIGLSLLWGASHVLLLQYDVISSHSTSYFNVT